MSTINYKQNPNFLFETNHWYINLARLQAYLGRCAIVLKRECQTLSDLTEEEWQELQPIINKLETALTKAFGATMFNWSCMMNSGYRTDPPTPQVHFHVKPRYEKSVEIAGHKFKDQHFGHHYDRDWERQQPEIDNSVREVIINRIKSNL